MVDRDAKQFAGIIASLSEVFESGEPSKTLIKIYWLALLDLDINDIQRAASDIIRTRVYSSLPKPADIIEAIRGTSTDRATGAWIKVLGTLRGVGSYQSVQFDDPVIHSCIEMMGGWPELGNMHIDDEKWKQREFEKLYPIMEKRGNHPTHLSGRFELDNTAKGYLENVEEPVKIGFDETKQIEASDGAAKGKG